MTTSRFPVAVTVALALLAVGVAGSVKPARARTFEFTYRALVKDLPENAGTVRVWIPVAVTDRNQTVRLKHVTSPVPTQVTRESEYGNNMLYAEFQRPAKRAAEFVLQYEVTRREYSKGHGAELIRRGAVPVSRKDPQLARFLEPNQLIPTGGRIKELSEEVTKGKDGAAAKARAAYDYLFTTFRYDKSGNGWGRGDALWACDAKRGNCTDFHSPFIGMMRAQGIPARFEIGFPLPGNASEGEIPGYHCWAEFYLNGVGWAPVDISEAWKDESRRDYFFGALDANRVQFSMGRDITLQPKQSGPPLNYFIYPYVEVDGRPYEAIEKKFAFRETAAH